MGGAAGGGGGVCDGEKGEAMRKILKLYITY